MRWSYAFEAPREYVFNGISFAEIRLGGTGIEPVDETLYHGRRTAEHEFFHATDVKRVPAILRDGRVKNGGGYSDSGVPYAVLGRESLEEAIDTHYCRGVVIQLTCFVHDGYRNYQRMKKTDEEWRRRFLSTPGHCLRSRSAGTTALYAGEDSMELCSLYISLQAIGHLEQAVRRLSAWTRTV